MFFQCATLKWLGKCLGMRLVVYIAARGHKAGVGFICIDTGKADIDLIQLGVFIRWNGTAEWNGMVEYWNSGMTTPIERVL